MQLQKSTFDVLKSSKSMTVILLVASLSACGGDSDGNDPVSTADQLDNNMPIESSDSDVDSPTTSTDVPSTEAPLIYEAGGGREAAIRLMKVSNAMVILLDAIPRAAANIANGSFQCAGGGSAEATVTEAAGSVQFNDCVLFIGNTMSVTGEFQYSTTEPSNRYTDITFRTADRVVMASGETGIRAIGVVAFTGPRDLTITEGQSTATITTGNTNLVRNDFAIGFDNSFEVVFSEEPDRIFTIDTIGQVGMPGFCPLAISFIATLDSKDQLELNLASGDNYTVNIGDNSDTIACSESGFFLETWPTRHR